MEPRRRRAIVLITLIVLIVCLYYRSGSSIPYHETIKTNISSYLEAPNVKPANATLGFGAIVAVSHAASPRRRTLLTAANITGLEITIPSQPTWTEDDIKAFRDPVSSIVSRGSILAWLGHLSALRWFLSTNLETVLILEDDVDWDIHLRTTQVPAVAAAARTLIKQAKQHGHHHLAGQQPLQPSSFLSAEQAGGFWGDTSPHKPDWDLLYLGHCGDIFPSTTWHNRSSPKYPSRLIFPDPTIPDRSIMHHFTKAFLDDLEIPEQTRLVHRSVAPLCTFGFALTRKAAEQLLYNIAPMEPRGGCVAYDVRILEACRDLGFKCWTSNPELFHHQDRPSLIENIDGRIPSSQDRYSKEHQEDEDDNRERREKEDERHREDLSDEERMQKDQERADRIAREKLEEIAEAEMKNVKDTVGVDPQGRLIGAAPNIRCGARGVGMYSEDEETLEYLREVVGRQGRCLRDEFAEEMSKWGF